MGLAKNFKSKPNRLYKYINGKSKDCTPIGPLEVDGVLIDDIPGMAEALLENYEKACTPFSPYTGNYTPTSNKVMGDIQITNTKVKKAFFNMSDSKAPGRDSLNPKIFKKLHKTVVPYMRKLIQYSYDNGFIYSHWQQVLIAPLYKPGKPRNLPQSYRPVSLMQISAKCCEKVLMDEWIKFMDKHNLMTGAQHAAKKRSGTLTNLTSYLDYVTKQTDSYSQIEVCGFDMSLAFDRARYSDIIDGVLAHGMSTKCAKWLYNFLTTRKVSVKLENHISRHFIPTSGTSQGSIAASHFFCCVMATLTKTIKSKFFIYCDDLRIVAPSSNIFEREVIQDDLNALSAWCDHRAFLINPLKSFNISFGKQYTKNSFFYKGQKIPKVSSSLDLGVVVNNSIDMKEQLDNTISSMRQKCQLAKKSFVPSATLRTVLWKSYVMGKFNYTCPLIPARYEYHKKAMMQLQHNFFKSVTFPKGVVPPEPILDELERHRLTYVWKIINGKVNVDKSIFSVYDHKRLGKNRIRFPHCRTSLRRRFFSVDVVPKWNKLPESARTAKTANAFKKILKKEFSSSVNCLGEPLEGKYKYRNKA